MLGTSLTSTACFADCPTTGSSQSAIKRPLADPGVRRKGGHMADWMFNRRGQACLILDGDRVRSRRGGVVGWISGSNVYSLCGAHIGWFDGGVIYDSSNSALVFTGNHIGYLPSSPGIGGTPGMPGFSGVPGKPGFYGTPGMPGRGGWSCEDPEHYFES